MLHGCPNTVKRFDYHSGCVDLVFLNVASSAFRLPVVVFLPLMYLCSVFLVFAPIVPPILFADQSRLRYLLRSTILEASCTQQQQSIGRWFPRCSAQAAPPLEAIAVG